MGCPGLPKSFACESVAHVRVADHRQLGEHVSSIGTGTVRSDEVLRCQAGSDPGPTAREVRAVLQPDGDIAVNELCNHAIGHGAQIVQQGTEPDGPSSAVHGGDSRRHGAIKSGHGRRATNIELNITPGAPRKSASEIAASLTGRKETPGCIRANPVIASAQAHIPLRVFGRSRPVSRSNHQRQVQRRCRSSRRNPATRVRSGTIKGFDMLDCTTDRVCIRGNRARPPDRWILQGVVS